MAETKMDIDTEEGEETKEQEVDPAIIEAQLKDKIKTPDLSDHEIMDIFLQIFPHMPSTGTKSKSGCWVITGHGNDLDIRDRPTILNEMAKLHADFNSPVERRKLSKYISDCVSLTMAMGLPGPSAPMQIEAERGRWAGLTTSEIDVQIVRNIYQLFQRYILYNGNNPVTNDMIEIVNYIARQQLRANFMQIWGPGGEFQLRTRGMWEADVRRLMDQNEIWVKKKIGPDSADRYYKLRPNVDDDPELRTSDGIHLIDMRDNFGREIANLVLPVAIYETQTGNVLPEPAEFEKNNIQFPEPRRRLEFYFTHVLQVPRDSKEDQVFRLIIGKIFSKTEPNIYISELCMLGYLLGIDNFNIYDPLCRPMSDESVVAETRSGAEYRGIVPALVAAHAETFPRQNSEEILKKINKKCNKKGSRCNIMGGKTKNLKKNKKEKKIKSKKSKKLIKQKHKRTQKHCRK